MTDRATVTAADVRALGVTTTVEEAGRVLGLGRSAAYDLARKDAFPVPVIKVTGRRWLVPTAPLLRLLGLDAADGSRAPASG
ncbi:hypothetical protein [Kribbella sp.]|uniref:hypothetical protein n=1 Tax=Kribbella sp. TaxID=1871183 RepID=UPI002D2329B9|nr:hypothetical protein [Kribbella sp.]HZX07193.1 hypothetical protein [Kribbella sp.]